MEAVGVEKNEFRCEVLFAKALEARGVVANMRNCHSS